ncbi:MAG: type II toxin-antitoxin system RnlA family toxin [Clostridiales bacterium]|nr:type II toxin-antitoxin system RnlA family toxin [Clostridiales bacterium]
MENVRYNISPCSRDEVQAFISRINAAVYAPRNTVFADERSHYDRYSFVRDDSKIAVVYDTTARVISITAPQDYADDLLTVFSPGDKAIKRSTVPAQGTKSNAVATQQDNTPRVVKTENNTRCRVFEKPKEPIRTSPTVIATAKGAEMYSDEIAPPQRMAKRNRTDSGADNNARRGNRAVDPFNDEIAPPQIVNARKADNTNSFDQNTANKQKTPFKPQYQTNEQKAQIADNNKQAQHAKQQPNGVTDSATGVRRATISFGGDDYTPSMRQTQVLRSGTGLYADISQPDSTPPQQAADNHAKRGRGRPPKTNNQTQSRENASPHEDKKLKRRIPTAYEFLPQQAREDLSGGLKNFEQTKLTMTDYSGLLMQPYRGLEAFVLDLQRAEGIRVKMIGQAFDKDDDGNYVLKSGYMQKIGSIVYGEVLVALYNEYCSRRNYFAHTDNSEDGSVPRSIPDRIVAKGMFDNLLKVVEYNARKLKEIGFGAKHDASRQA